MRTPRRSLLLLSLLLAAPLLASPFVASEAAAQRRRHRTFVTERGGPELTIRGRAATGIQPKSVNVSPDGRRVVVCNFGRPNRDNVFVYDAYTLERVGSVDFEGNAVESLFTRDGRTLYVSNFREHRIEVIDFRSLRVVAEIPTAHHPKMMALSPDESLLYAANWGSRSVSVIDTRARRELRRLPTGVHPRGLTVLQDGTLLAAAFHSDVIHVFPPGATEESTRYRMCRFPRHILHSPDSSTFYVTCSLGSVGFYRAGEGRRFGVGYTHRNPRTIDITHDGRFIGVANFSSSDVSLVDTRDHRHQNYALPGASRVVGLAMHPGPGIRMYATSWDTAELYMLTDAAADAAAPASARSGQ